MLSRYTATSGLIKTVFTRMQSTVASTVAAETVEQVAPVQAEESDELSLLRLREYNAQVVANLAELSRTPASELQLDASKASSPAYKQLDEQLHTFLTNFAIENRIYHQDEVVTRQANSKKFPYLVPSASDKPYSPQELFLRQRKHAEHAAKLGANLSGVYQPHRDIYHAPQAKDVSVDMLLSAGVHLGQSTSLWRPSTQSFIYGEYKGIHIIDLEQTLVHLKRAAKVVEGVAAKGGIILFLGTREGQKRALQNAASKTGGYYVASRWIPGTLTNPTEISGVWERVEVDEKGIETGRELTADEKVGIVKPDLLVVLNPTENRNALKEAMQVRVPTIGIIDTDSEPSLVTYPIPGNDDSIRSVNLLVSVLARAGEKGRQQ